MHVKIKGFCEKNTKEQDAKKTSKGYTPSQISSIILSKLKDYTSGVKKAVVTVPAMFADAARDATGLSCVFLSAWRSARASGQTHPDAPSNHCTVGPAREPGAAARQKAEEARGGHRSTLGE